MLSRLPWSVVVIMCLTLGLAPFSPQPHIFEKLLMLWNLELTRPLDIFDLFFHGIPWLLLTAKIFSSVFFKGN